MQLSGLVVTTNEEEVIEEALKSLQTCCDEIVVVLDKVTDGTKAIAKKYADTLIEGEWESEGERRGLGIDACKGKWILEVDADERVTPDMADEVKAFVTHAPFGYALIPIYNYVGTRHVQYGWAGSFGTTRAKKLFQKGAKVWGQERVHPSLTLTGQEMSLTHGLDHMVDKDINDMIDRLKRYSDAAARDMRTHGQLPPFRTTLRKGLTRFYKSYVARKGYKEGRMGFLLATMAALFPILSHIKAELEA